MKKVWSIILVAVLLAVTLTACGGNPLVGTWKATIGGDAGELVLNEDGTGSLTSNGETRPCVWKAENDTLTVVQTISGLQFVFLDEVTYTVKWGTLTITNPENGNVLKFKKK